MDKQQLLDRRYMRMARIWAENSYCKRRQVGALLVKDQMIISDGFNGTPSGFENNCEDEDNVTKWYVLHAEANAPQLGQLKAEFVDLGVSQRNGLAGLFSALGILLDAGKQLSGERTQFIRGHGGQGLGVELRQERHSFKYAAARGGSPSAHALIAGRPEFKRG